MSINFDKVYQKLKSKEFYWISMAFIFGFCLSGIFLLITRGEDAPVAIVNNSTSLSENTICHKDETPSFAANKKPIDTRNLTAEQIVKAIQNSKKDKMRIEAHDERLPASIQQLPLIDSPRFQAQIPRELVTNNERQLSLAWDSVEGARSYLVRVTDPSGNEIKTFATSSTNVEVKEVPIYGNREVVEYQVSLYGVDSWGRRGNESEKRRLTVQRPPDLRPPEVTEIQVED